ncbi:TPA: amidohydrolase family protein [Legionella pneumophila]|uniref:amidohydrolase family protein n=1 Tax=Legionella pneumophila TaxID=446 RepID=UPI000770A846|nr:amidohydrolase family protein [Legionella pneumophila]MDW8900873.1 amidohydrolase family protein [Legionella pneumophila]MDW8905684.1 amidohydrolase family protein [Legionella pneumophila]CZG89600.1 Predicted metal-dependent hydrolase of the TIM-barrel fold [Legionella pneumophila]STX83744.1 (2-pyrone-4,6-)dicarboxylic acid hydrolase [Legionella pneumophila]HAT1792079.1 amidohydrolase family protein [Legionella pneumophila]
MLKLFDAHFHIIDYRFPLVANQSYLPPEFTVEDYLQRAKPLNICGGAVVSGSFQAFDQTYLLTALSVLGPNFVGVTQLPATVSDEEIIQLNQHGIRAVRFNLKRGSSESIHQLKYFAHRIYEMVRWHVEIYVDSKELGDLTNLLLELPAVSIDHLGLSQSGFSELLHLVEHGIKIKASGFGRVDFDVKKALQTIAQINPDALLFGTDLPSTRAPRPFLDSDIQLIQDLFDEELTEKILYRNACNFYIKNKPLA